LSHTRDKLAVLMLFVDFMGHYALHIIVVWHC